MMKHQRHNYLYQCLSQRLCQRGIMLTIIGWEQEGSKEVCLTCLAFLTAATRAWAAAARGLG